MPDAALGFLIFCVRKGGSDMEYRAQEVIQYAREEKVKFVRLAFSDVYGRQKNVTIMASELERAYRAKSSLRRSIFRRIAKIVRSSFTRSYTLQK